MPGGQPFMNPAPNSDKEYFLLNEIEANQDISQRGLSQKTGLSLGTINLLLQKMIKQGLVKMETIPANRVIYMLTPVGLAEKAAKTVRYIRNHYHIIQETKEKIRQKLEYYHQQYAVLYICKSGNELDNLVKAAVDEYLGKHPDHHIQMISSTQAASPDNLPYSQHAIILYLPEESNNVQPIRHSGSSIPVASFLETWN
jgi:DNA-binding MarR family transcriptional regulator